jgi:L-seryl-tRNA(Ser) seleniumtransferase
MTGTYRSLPSVDRVLTHEVMKRAAAEVGLRAVTDAARDEIAEVRAALANSGAEVSLASLVEAAAARAYASLRATLRPVINATGVIIHTNLGRAPLSDATLTAMAAVSRGYSNLEFDLDAGERGSRYVHLEALVCHLTGAEAAIAVNNNAAAVLLALSSLAQARDVVISRGELVEIGGGFRIPDVMAQSGARLVEAGTTNRTYARDYEAAIGEETAALMHVHRSNFRLLGFVESPSLHDLATLAHSRDLLLLDDLGSGCLLDTRTYGLSEEPTPQESIRAGADLVLFSGDKLLGGPQAGIIAGRADLIARLRRHPLARALRMDKASIAGLHATLLHYARDEAEQQVPVWRMISTPIKTISARARRWSRLIGEEARLVDGRSMIGGGSLPEESLPTRLVAINAGGGVTLEAVAKRLRTGEPAVVGRIEDGRLLLDPRTVAPIDDAALVRAVKLALSG